jgi:type I restriction enzyme S subunit
MPFQDHEHERYGLKVGDIVICEGGEAGRAAIWDGRLPDLKFQKAIHRVRPGPRLHNRYFVHRLMADHQAGRLDDYLTGATIKHFTGQDLARYKFPLPPLAEQRWIAKVLDRAEALRAKRRAALAQLDSLTQSLFLDLFGDPAFNQRQFQRVRLTDACHTPDDIKCGPFGTQLAKDEFTSEGVPLWGIKNVNSKFELQTEEFLERRTAKRLAQYSIKAGDIVMTRKGTVGNCAVYPTIFPDGIMHSDLLRVRVSRAKCEPAFLAHQLHHSRDVERQLALISGGAVMPGINVTKLKELEVVIPPLPLQQKFARRISAVEKLMAAQRASLAELDALFASLQHRAFRGEL